MPSFSPEVVGGVRVGALVKNGHEGINGVRGVMWNTRPVFKGAQGNFNKNGNFLELVEFRARTDALLASHLQNAPKSARYMCFKGLCAHIHIE